MANGRAIVEERILQLEQLSSFTEFSDIPEIVTASLRGYFHRNNG